MTRRISGPQRVAGAGMPLRRAGQSARANGVLFLVSDAPSYMKGAELVMAA
jgi:hypothetical protein